MRPMAALSAANAGKYARSDALNQPTHNQFPVKNSNAIDLHKVLSDLA